MTTRRATMAVAVAMLPMAMIDPAAAKTLKVVASFTVLADMVRQVGGDRVVVVSMVPPDGDPQEYEPTPDNARNLKGADVVFTSGLGLEGWFARLTKASGYAGKPVVASDGIRTRKMEEDGKTITVPPAWNSIPNAEVYVGNIQKALAAANPEDTGAFASNARTYDAKLNALDAYAHAQVDGVPKNEQGPHHPRRAQLFRRRLRRELPFASRLLHREGTVGRAGGEGDRTDQGRTRPRLFLREFQRPTQIGNATSARPGGELFVEALSKPDGPAPTYADMFKSNVVTLVAGMKGPPRS